MILQRENWILINISTTSEEEEDIYILYLKKESMIVTNKSSHFAPSSFFDLNDFPHQALFKPTKEVWFALKEIEAYLNNYKLGSIEGTIDPKAFLIDEDKITIGKGSIVEPGAYIKGPCIIGSHCIIRHGAYIRGGVITGNDCIIGHDTEAKNVILLNHAYAAHFAYLGDSILGNRVNIGAGVKCANLRMDGKEICLNETKEGKAEKVHTGLRKFGAIIGDGSQLGCNCVTNPGTILGKGVFCYPCENIHGIIPAHHIVKPLHKSIVVKSHDN